MGSSAGFRFSRLEVLKVKEKIKDEKWMLFKYKEGNYKFTALSLKISDSRQNG